MSRPEYVHGPPVASHTLVRQHRLQPWDIGLGELRVDPRVIRAHCDEIVDHRRDGVLPELSIK
jgi:hypothetical protein